MRVGPSLSRIELLLGQHGLCQRCAMSESQKSIRYLNISRGRRVRMLLNYAASMRLSPVQPFFHRVGFIIEKPLASDAAKSYTAAFRGEGKTQSSNRFEALSVYGTTGLERCRERLLCSLDLP